ncbi:hypothetical protein FGO68_gene10688 [Halteria grandinella]|uniref:Uncharacterized protein n=1 Tax=Halteria grandinella TaxID=5974 RepID=A0A8J8P5N3_HALGN|nr:hypothetical protein FGO68_gene10688 [Halteria grandinella]
MVSRSMQAPHWSRWLGYSAFTRKARVRVPDGELFFDLSLFDPQVQQGREKTQLKKRVANKAYNYIIMMKFDVDALQYTHSSKHTLSQQKRETYSTFWGLLI